MRSLTLAAVGCLAAATVHAQFTYLSDSRSVSAYAEFLAPPGSSQSVTASPPFADFNRSAGADARGAFASGGQISSLSPSELYYSASALAGGVSQDFALGRGDSLFSASFSVSNPIPYCLTCNGSEGAGGNASASLGWTLSSSAQGVITSQTCPPDQPSWPSEYIGTFLPNQTYTLEAKLLMTANLGQATGVLQVICVGGPPLVPAVWTLSATAVTPTNATLNGTANPNGWWPTTA